MACGVEAIGQRITSGWRRFGVYSRVLQDRKIPICLKRKIMDATNKRSGEEACSGPTKHGEIVVKYCEKRQDPK